MNDTIFALSSGSPPAAIAVIRISGADARATLHDIGGVLPKPRQAVLRTLRGADGVILDQALVLWMPGPSTATGEDCVELHCHGGRAIVSAVRAALGARQGLREAEPGEFTRRAFANGRIDLAQAEALGDLLTAETELQRRVAQADVGGALSKTVEAWRVRVLALSAMLEAVLDFADDDDVHELPSAFFTERAALHDEILQCLARPRTDTLRNGIRVVIAGPPNSGKSSLFNTLSGEDAAIVSPLAGTTRDVIERPVAFRGIPFVLVDTAGLREQEVDAIESLGIARAHAQLTAADIVLWLGEEGEGPDGAVEVQSRCDDPGVTQKADADYIVSSKSKQGIEDLQAGLVARADHLLPKPGLSTVNARQAHLLEEALIALNEAHSDQLILAESLRAARSCFDRLVGRAGVEDMLDSLFGRFCIGK